MTVTRRPAVQADRGFVRTTHHAAYEDAVRRQFGRWDLTEQDDFFDRSWQPDEAEIILLDGVPAGYCVIELRDDDVHVRELVVHPDFQNRGVGTAVLFDAQSHGRPVVLGTFHVNRAQVLYERLGFVRFDSSDTHVFMRWTPAS